MEINQSVRQTAGSKTLVETGKVDGVQDARVENRIE